MGSAELRTTPLPRVFLDTTALKFAASRLVRGFRRSTLMRWGSVENPVEVVQFRVLSPNDKLTGTLRRDVNLLALIARVATRRRLELLHSLDTSIEFWRLPRTDDTRGVFFGAPLTRVSAPVSGSRIIAGGTASMEQYQLNFLRSIKDERFLDLQRATGAYQWTRINSNQLIDAFHIWTAESAGADFLLTCDYRLIRHVERHRQTRPKVTLVTPSGLVDALRQRGTIGMTDRIEYLFQRCRARFARGPEHPLESLARLGDALEKRGYYR